MLNKTINNFLSNKNSKWSINSFDSFEQYLLERFAEYYFDEKLILKNLFIYLVI